MDLRKTTLQRAFELASSGNCFNLHDIIIGLQAERHETAQLKDTTLKKLLMQVIDSAQEKRAENELSNS
jgi:hypothetical protein